MVSVLRAETQYKCSGMTENVVQHIASWFVGSHLSDIILGLNECIWQDMYHWCNKRRVLTESEWWKINLHELGEKGREILKFAAFKNDEQDWTWLNTPYWGRIPVWILWLGLR
jgi:hypothetical protein